MDDLLQQGVTAYRTGKRDEARKFFIAFIKQNPESESGWGWMYNTSNDDKTRRYCLRQMLRINPNNKRASQLLKQLPNSKSTSNSGGLARKAVIIVSIALVCLIGICSIGFLFFKNDNKIASTIETPMSIEQIIELTSSAANAQTAASYSPTPLSTLTIAPLETIPTATIFIFQLQTDIARPTEYIYSTNTPFILAQPTSTLIVVPLPTSGGSGGGCCKYCGANSKACGDSCISNSYSCNKPSGCACEG